MTENNNILDERKTEMGAKNLGINILTILTIIGSAIALLSAIFSLVTIENSYKAYEKMQGMTESTGNDFVDGILNNAQKVVKISYANRYAIMAVGIIGSLLCLFGALQMRKGALKGLWLWLVGEWIPVIMNTLLIGVAALAGIQLIAAIVPIMFTILYLAHKKYLA